MKAAILVEQHKPLIVDKIDMPQHLEAGQVLVKIHYSGICGSQLGEINGAKGNDKYLPHLLGHEGSGSVLEVGPGVKHVSPGDLVVLHWRRGLGMESAPPVYRWRGVKLNAGWITTFNEFAIISENRMTVISSDSDLQVSALFGCAVTTGFGVIENNARVRIGESVVVYGAGGVGLNIVQAASLVGAFPIIAVDLFDNRLEMANQFGATHIINSQNSNAKDTILNINGGKGVDVFIDNTGIPGIIEMGYELISHEGRVILVGVPKVGYNINIYSLPLHFGKRLIGSHGGEAVPDKDISRYMALYNNKRIKLKELITEVSNIEQINDAIMHMTTGETSGRILVRFD
jgi:S-(hydroxymethyl)glutathione dehydrogenase/alcohol dehydrogenase